MSSKIEWTQETWNPVTGCTKISEGCKNCYAERMTKRLVAMRQKKYSEGFDKVVFHPKELKKDFGKKPKMIFVNSMSDTFHECVDDKNIVEILATCAVEEQHIFQILTKRAERLRYFEPCFSSNIWLGVTVEKPDYKYRINYLKHTNAKIKFLSCEPLLGDLGELDLSGIDWVIVGGESGPGARFCNALWVKNIRNQCVKQNVPFFFKQWGEYLPDCQNPDMKNSETYYLGGIRLGKKKAGRLLDGILWDQMPKETAFETKSIKNGGY